ncbi:MAG: nitrite/sulfite reductase [Bacteroidales bacterium]|nr:nitrite/sulfite reductase [Bacteroidales bacterium]
MYRITENLIDNVLSNQQQIEKYKRGEINSAELKSGNVKVGVYEQRKDGTFMLRIRCAGGFITPKQLKDVALTAIKNKASHVHLTTRQELQIHGVSIDSLSSMMLYLKDSQLSTLGGGGDTVRNIIVNELSGIEASQVFDTYPYAVELTSRLTSEPDSLTLPRKLKIAFDINEQTADSSLIQDLGFIPVERDGNRGFRVLLGGSVASNPHKGWQIFDFLPEKDVFRAAKAAKNFFNLYGDREHRNKSRIRYIFYKFGDEEAKRLYYQEYDKLLGDNTLDFQPTKIEFEYTTPGFAPENDSEPNFAVWKSRYAVRQTFNNERNFWSVHIPVVTGNIDAETLRLIADFLSGFGNDVVRFTSRQNIQLRNIPEVYLPNVYHFLKAVGFEVDSPLIINNITSCTGAAVCRLGICRPSGLEKAIINRLLNSNIALDEIPHLKININGCLNSCAQNAWSDLGFSGRIGHLNNHAYPAYNVWAKVGGEYEIAENLGFLPAKNVPEFVGSFLKIYLDNKQNYASYGDFIVRDGATTIRQLIGQLSQLPDFEDDKNYYVDYGAEEFFGKK